MRPQSCKAKGRRLQQFVASEVREAFALAVDDVRSTSMGANGEDVQLSAAARERFPFAVECKNTERLNLWDAWAQATANARTYSPLLVVRKNHSDTLCVLNWGVFLELARRPAAPPTDAPPTAAPPSAAEEVAKGGEPAAPPSAAGEVAKGGESAAPHAAAKAARATLRLDGAEDARDLARALREIAARLDSAA